MAERIAQEEEKKRKRLEKFGPVKRTNGADEPVNVVATINLLCLLHTLLILVYSGCEENEGLGEYSLYPGI